MDVPKHTESAPPPHFLAQQRFFLNLHTKNRINMEFPHSNLMGRCKEIEVKIMKHKVIFRILESDFFACQSFVDESAPTPLHFQKRCYVPGSQTLFPCIYKFMFI